MTIDMFNDDEPFGVSDDIPLHDEGPPYDDDADGLSDIRVGYYGESWDNTGEAFEIDVEYILGDQDREDE